jgi:hypothetical protein
MQICQGIYVNALAAVELSFLWLWYMGFVVTATPRMACCLKLSGLPVNARLFGCLPKALFEGVLTQSIFGSATTFSPPPEPFTKARGVGGVQADGPLSSTELLPSKE